MKCPVCGHPDGACTGTGPARQVITSGGVQQTRAPMRVPRQRTHIGRTGYIGPVEVYDEKLPHVRFVSHEIEADEPVAAVDAPNDEPGAEPPSWHPEFSPEAGAGSDSPDEAEAPAPRRRRKKGE